MVSCLKVNRRKRDIQDYLEFLQVKFSIYRVLCTQCARNGGGHR